METWPIWVFSIYILLSLWSIPSQSPLKIWLPPPYLGPIFPFPHPTCNFIPFQRLNTRIWKLKQVFRSYTFLCPPFMEFSFCTGPECINTYKKIFFFVGLSRFFVLRWYTCRGAFWRGADTHAQSHVMIILGIFLGRYSSPCCLPTVPRSIKFDPNNK